ncbi:MAG: TetR/AcrR family transcriptional regulator [Kofleriaceae bacterium]
MADVVSRAPVEALERGKLERRQQILEAAKQVFAEAGYHGASINAIIERAQIARGTFYLYFQSKAAVFDSILDQAMADLRARLHRIDVEDPAAAPPQVQLHDQVAATLGYVVGDRPLATLLLQSASTPAAEAAERLDQFYAEVRELIRRALEQGTAIGLLRPCQPELTAGALLGMVRGVIEVMMRSPDPQPVHEVVRELISIGLRGVLAR